MRSSIGHTGSFTNRFPAARGAALAAFLAAGLALPGAVHGQYTFTVAAQAGQVVAGQSSPLNSVGVPFIDADGAIAFKTTTHRVIVGQGGSLSFVTSGVSGGYSSIYGFGNAQVLAGFSWTIPFGGGLGFRTEYGGAGTVQTIQLKDGPVPGYPSGTQWAQMPVAATVGAGGHAVFTDGYIDAVFRCEPGSGPVLLLRSGTQASPGVVWTQLRSLGVNEGGQAIVRYSYSSLLSSGWALRTAGPGSGSVVAYTGIAAPGGGTFVADGSNINASINNAGQVALSWRATPSGISGDAGVWRYTPGVGLEMVAREGQPAPGAGLAVFGEPRNFDDYRSTVIGGDGSVALVAPIVGPEVNQDNNTAIFTGGPGSLGMVVREGNPAPGTGANFQDLMTARLNINARGDVYFWANLDNNKFGVFRKPANGPLEKLLATGDEIMVNGQPREVYTITVLDRDSGVQDGRGAWVNDQGEVVLAVNFSDLTTIVVVGTPPLPPVPCYANCDGSTTQPALNVNDFVCFQQKYASGAPDANCDGSTLQPVLNVNDFVCFQQKFAAGCP